LGTCRNKKKEEPTTVATKATIQVGKPLRLLNYPCHIYGIVGQKLTNYPRFSEMQSMFKDKGGQSTKSKPIAEVKTVTASVNMVDVNVTTQNKTSEEKMFKN
jgi:hypothetical protein